MRKADARTKVFEIGGGGQQGLGGRFEQDRVYRGLVLVGDVGDRRWQGEDEMVVGHWQQIVLPGGEPRVGRRPLATG